MELDEVIEVLLQLGLPLGQIVRGREDHGIGPFSSTARDTSNPRPVYTGLREFEARGETTTIGVSRYVAKDPFFHQISSEVAKEIAPRYTSGAYLTREHPTSILR